MERYKIAEILGNGSYATVMKGVLLSTGEPVAIKKMHKKFYSWEECLELQEIIVLRQVSHPNIVKLKEAVRANDELFLIFEHCDSSLLYLRPQRDSEVKAIMKQCLSGLHALHQKGFLHRDLKPENILLKSGFCKIADLGLAKEIRSKPPHTEYVSTRWYRAPELLLHSKRYSAAIDIFALGCIMAELIMGRPLAAGANEIDQLNKLCCALGAPEQWLAGHRLAASVKYCFPLHMTSHLQTLMPTASPLALQLLSSMLTWDPSTRPSALDCLNHPYFREEEIQSPLGLALWPKEPIRRQTSVYPENLTERSDRQLRSFRASAACWGLIAPRIGERL